WLGALAALSLLAGCVAPTPPPKPPKAKLVLEQASFSAMPGWNQDQVATALPALIKSCARRLAQPATAKVGPNGIAGTVDDWRAPCAEAARLPPGNDVAARAYFERWFRPFLATADGNPDGLFTGYYEPLLDGARRKGGAYETPLLRRPPDLVMVQLGQFRAVCDARRDRTRRARCEQTRALLGERSRRCVLPRSARLGQSAAPGRQHGQPRL